MMKQKIQWFFDIQTKVDELQVLSVEAGGENVRKRLAGFFGMYRNFKLGRISVKLVPAATLPVDPTGLSLEAGQNTIDPRDQLSPGMIRITNGENIMQHQITSLTPAKQREIYNAMMLDPRWFKFMLQKGTSRSAIPLYWNVGQLEQDAYPGTVVNYPRYGENDALEGTVCYQTVYEKNGGTISNRSTVKNGCSDPRGLFQVGRERIGWLPTTGCAGAYGEPLNPAKSTGYLTPIPSVEVMNIILPPAYRTVYYYRVFVTEEVLFKDVMQTGTSEYDYAAIMYGQGSLDNFQSMTLIPSKPGFGIENNINETPNDGNSGGPIR